MANETRRAVLGRITVATLAVLGAVVIARAQYSAPTTPTTPTPMATPTTTATPTMTPTAAATPTTTPTTTGTPTSAPTTTPVNTILDFHEMAPVAGPYVGTANPVRGVQGDTLPWAIGHADGTLRSDGMLEVNVSGLVVTSDPSVPAAERGINPSPMFIAIVGCKTVQGGAPKDVQVMTPPAPATTTGDSRIQATVQLPTPCIDPVVLVAGTNGLWFAATGR
jgi:hypothetical protein